MYYKGVPITGDNREEVPPEAKDEMNLHAKEGDDIIPPYCNKDLPTLSVAKDRIIKFSEWKKFLDETPFFILGVTDSGCRTCCESESILQELDQLAKDETIMWTQEKKKKKKTKVTTKPI